MIASPSIDEIAEDPSRLKGLSETALSALLARCGAAQGAIIAALITAGLSKKSRLEKDELSANAKMLNVHEASEILQVKPRWFYRNAPKYQFIQRLSRKKLLICEKGLREWLASRP
jgi:hypothetical protein